MKTLALDSLEEVREETGLETESGGAGTTATETRDDAESGGRGGEGEP